MNDQHNAVINTIGICGSQASGKTVYLCMLTEELRSHTNLRLFAADEHTKRYVKDRVQWFRGGERAPGTLGQERLRFSVERDESGLSGKLARGLGSAIFSPYQLTFDVIDTAGGHFEDAAELAQSPDADEMRKLIDKSAVLLWFIDPIKLEQPSARTEIEDQAEVLFRLLRSRQPSERPKRIAAILTKTDYFKGAAAERVADPASYLRTTLGQSFSDLEELLEEDNFKTFAVSSWGDHLGGRKGSDSCEPPARLEPRGVVEPFRWAVEPLTTPGELFRNAFRATAEHDPGRVGVALAIALLILLVGAAGTSSWLNYSDLPDFDQKASDVDLLRHYDQHQSYLDGWTPTHFLFRSDVAHASLESGIELDRRTIAASTPIPLQSASADDIKALVKLEATMLTGRGRQMLSERIARARTTFLDGPQSHLWIEDKNGNLQALEDFSLILILLEELRTVLGTSESAMQRMVDAPTAKSIHQHLLKSVEATELSNEGLEQIASISALVAPFLVSDDATYTQANALRRAAAALQKGLKVKLIIDKIKIAEEDPVISDSIGSPDPYVSVAWEGGSAESNVLEDEWNGDLRFAHILPKWTPDRQVTIQLHDSDLLADDTAAESINIDTWRVLASKGYWLEATGWKVRVKMQDLPDAVATLAEVWIDPKLADEEE